MSSLIDPGDLRLRLGVDSMDETHREFVELINALAQADRASFISKFRQLIEHTETHFHAENRLMEETGFAATREHKDEHLRVLGELNRIGAKVAKGSVMLGRTYVREQLPTWFSLHAITMDSALAAHIRSQQLKPSKA
ncbi:MAG: hemerythrin domain-containing protein [Candidatus Thiodiazotropha endolucinida]|nr:hemerythrin domain-containing protein [Candidatus Thiodiazotropha endolucinida]